mgnify:CR=1 FL=1
MIPKEFFVTSGKAISPISELDTIANAFPSNNEFKGRFVLEESEVRTG